MTQGHVGLPGRQPARSGRGRFLLIGGFNRHRSAWSESGSDPGGAIDSTGNGGSMLSLSNSDDSVLEYDKNSYYSSSEDEDECEYICEEGEEEWLEEEGEEEEWLEEGEEEEWLEEEGEEEEWLEEEEEEDSSEPSVSPSAGHLTPPSHFAGTKPLSRSPLPPSAFMSSFSSSASGNSPNFSRSTDNRKSSSLRGVVASSQSFDMSEEEQDGDNEESNMYERLMSDDDEDKQPQSLTRLMSLEARRGGGNGTPLDGNNTDSDEDFDEEKLSPPVANGEKKEVKTPLPVMSNPAPLEPVGLFWDIENCPVPMDKSAFSLANKMRSTFFHGKREAEFMCVCDITKERKNVIDELHKAHVSTCTHILKRNYIRFLLFY